MMREAKLARNAGVRCAHLILRVSRTAPEDRLFIRAHILGVRFRFQLPTTQRRIQWASLAPRQEISVASPDPRRWRARNKRFQSFGLRTEKAHSDNADEFEIGSDNVEFLKK